MYKYYPLIILAFLLGACTNVSIRDNVEAEEYAVYSAAIEAIDCSEDVSLLIIRDHTEIYPEIDKLSSALQYAMQRMPAVQEETLNDYKAKNNKVYPLKEQFALKVQYALISEEDINDIFQLQERGWSKFYSKYPGAQGIISLSRVGFNTQRDQAFVYIGNQQYWLVGRGCYVLLAKHNNLWRIQDKIIMWIS